MGIWGARRLSKWTMKVDMYVAMILRESLCYHPFLTRTTLVNTTVWLHNWLTLRRVFVAFFVASFRYTVPSLTWRINTCSRKPRQIEMDKPLFSLCFSLVVVSSFSYEGKDDDLLLTSRNSCGLSAALNDTDKQLTCYVFAGLSVLALMGWNLRTTTRQESSRKEFQKLAMSSDRVPCRELACWFEPTN